jgi:hypothetical protein
VDELEDFKTHINLSEYAAAQGYEIDRHASSKNSVLMHNSSGDKIVIARGHDRHWIYFSVHEDSDNGTIIDFVQNRKGVKLGGVRQELRPWVGSSRAIARPHPDLFAAQIEPVAKDRARVLLELARMKPMLSHAYLEEGRGLPASLLRSPRFAGKIKTDFRGNAVFAHADKDGPCGYEIKNKGFTGFSPGGDKGLWFSAVRKEDTALAIAESAIDALSYAALHPDQHARYASIGGAMNPGQPALIRAAIEKMGQGAKIILAMDNDAAGRALAERIEALARETGRSDLSIVRHLPEGEGMDWNDCLKARASPCAPKPAAGP